MVNGMDRFGALMTGQITDRVPVVCTILDQGAKELGMSIKEYYSKGEYVAEGQIRLRNKYGHDNLWGVHYAARDAEILGSRNTLFFESGPPNVGHMVIKSNEDIEKFEIPDDILAIPQFQEQLKTIEILVKEYKGTYPIFSYVIGSFSLPPLLMGIDKWLHLLLLGPDSLRRELLQKCSLFCRKKIKALRDAGVDMISYANSVATGTFLTAEQFDALALDSVQKDLSEGGAEGLVYFNGGGRINPMLNTLIEKVGFTAFNISPDDDIAEAKKIINGRGLLASSINDIKLIKWSKEEIDQEVKRIVEAGAPGGGFIFGTLLMPYLIPDQNIETMIQAVRKYGDYSRYEKRQR